MIFDNPQLEAFMSVYESGTVSRAAEKLGLTQTGVTQRILSLEKRLKTPLFLRSRRGMLPTAEGESLRRYCIEAKEIEGKLLSSLQQRNENQEISLTVTGPANILGSRMVPKCAGLYRTWPRLNIRLLIDVNANRLGHLKKGTADLAVVLQHEVTPELDSKVLKPLEYVLVGSIKWRSRSLRDILTNERQIAYHPEDKTGLNYLEKFDLTKYGKKNKLYANENQIVRKMLEAELGFAILPNEIVRDLVEQKKITVFNQGKSIQVPMALAWYPRKEMPAYFKDIISTIT